MATGLDVVFVETDLFEGVGGRFDLVVSNPPYVLPDEVDALEPEVRDWEPRAALIDHGQTGRLAAQAAGRCTWLVLEVHPERVAAIVTELQRLGYAEVAVRTDLAARERIVEGRWSG
jgi:release factor glutamine methyltransferase